MGRAPVPVPAGQDVNVVMSRHIDGGCKREAGTGKGTTALSANKCAVCGKSELAPIMCKACGDVFCLKHRHADQHSCGARKRTKLTARFGLAGASKAPSALKAVRR